MKYSVIIPFLNEEAYLGRLLEQLAAQTYKNFEVIVVDSASTDNSVAVVKQYLTRLNLKLVTTGRGVAKARNVGAKAARGEWLIFLDADVQLPSHFIARLDKKVADIDIAAVRYRTDSWNPLDKLGVWLSRGYQWLQAQRGNPSIMGFCIVIRRQLHQKIKGFNQKLPIGEDYDYSTRAFKAGGRFGRIQNTYLILSLRRYDQEGRLRLFLKTLLMEYYRLFRPAKLKQIRYQFGDYQTKRRRHRWLRWLLLIVLINALFAWQYQLRHRQESPQMGVSFSVKYAEELGLDPQVTLTAITEELGITNLRLMSYWDRLEPTQDQYRFEELDWQMDQAAKTSSQVSLAIGLKQPRWPECHYPEWARSKPQAEQQGQLLEFIEAVVNRYSEHPALASYQLENEAANNNFGDCPKYDASFLGRELDLVRRLDTDHPVITNAGSQIGTPLRGPVGDQVGFSVYRRITANFFGKHLNWHYWYMPSLWHSWRAALVEVLHQKPVIIHELQAEPWGARPTKELSVAEQAQTMDPDKLIGNVKYAKRIGASEIYLWGAEWWYWRHLAGDNSLWEIAKALY